MSLIGPVRADNTPHALPADRDALADFGKVIPGGNARESVSLDDRSDLTNVVPFVRRRDDSAARQAAPAIVVGADARPARPHAEPRDVLYWSALLLVSAAAHAALYLPFGQEPPPLASIGEVAVSVELVLGANQDAGLSSDQGQLHASAPLPAQAAEPVVEQTSVDEQPQQTAATPVAAEAGPHTSEETPPLQIMREPPPRLVATPKPQIKPRASERPSARERRKPESRQAKLSGEPNESATTTPAATAASGVGRGRSDANTNYRGLVAAHLARHKQFPPDARNRGDQGSAVVTFSLNGRGGVTAVSLSRGTGAAALDHETIAMVRRASPFPVPPDGRGHSFTVPVSFRLW